MGSTRRFEFVGGGSSKFWHITLDGAAYTVTFGRIGTAGQSQTKTFGNAALAQAEHDKIVREKVGKGYTEVASEAAAAVTPPPPPAENERRVSGLVQPESFPATLREASVDDLPPARTSSSRSSDTPSHTPRVIHGLQPADVPDRIVWEPGQREAWQRFVYGGEDKRSAANDKRAAT